MSVTMLGTQIDPGEALGTGQRTKMFGEVLREFRKEHNITVSSLSENSGITSSALFRIEVKDPNRTPNRSTIANLFLSLSLLSGRTLEEVYRYFLERIGDPKQIRQIEEGKEVALRTVKISKETNIGSQDSMNGTTETYPLGGEK